MNQRTLLISKKFYFNLTESEINEDQHVPRIVDFCKQSFLTTYTKEPKTMTSRNKLTFLLHVDYQINNLT